MGKMFFAAFTALLITSTLSAKDNPSIINSVGKACDRKASPFSFKENKGQITDQYNRLRTDIQFHLAAPDGVDIFIGRGAMHYQFSTAMDRKIISLDDILDERHSAPEKVNFRAYRMDVMLENANPDAEVIKEQQHDYLEHYFLPTTGNAGATVHMFNRITYKNIYPNIDQVLYTCEGQMKYEFVVRTGGKVSDIKIKYYGTTSLQLNDDGVLTAATPMGTIVEDAPFSIQQDGKEVHTVFKLAGNTVSYEVAPYNGDLVIDPTISWGTYYGGSGIEFGLGVAVDYTGDVYMAGAATTPGLATVGAFDTVYTSPSSSLLVKFAPSGARLWATYYYKDAMGCDVVTDDSANVYMVGFTADTSNHGTTGSYQTSVAGGNDIFLVKFDDTGARKWSTFYGGTGNEEYPRMAFDHFRGIYIAATTFSTTGIATAGAWQTTYTPSLSDLFLAKFDTSGARLWATYYGGNDEERIARVSTNIYGNVFLAGSTKSASSIASPGSFMSVYAGEDAFLARFDSTGVRKWGTYYGGTCLEQAQGLDCDDKGNIYLQGNTCSISGIATTGAFQTTFSGGYDGYAAKFDTAGNRLWATYYGGTNIDYIRGVFFDPLGNKYLVGISRSTSGIATPGAYQTTNMGDYDAYVALLDSSGSTRSYGTYYGGPMIDNLAKAATNNAGSIFICGETESSSGISVGAAFQPVSGGYREAFLAKFSNPTLSVSVREEKSAAEVNLFPNPTSDNITITTDENAYSLFSITNCLGETIYSTTITGAITTISTVSLAQGIYYIKCFGKFNTIVKPFVKM